MATYIENDVRNIFVDIYNRGTIVIAVIYYGVLRTILCDRFKDV